MHFLLSFLEFDYNDMQFSEDEMAASVGRCAVNAGWLSGGVCRNSGFINLCFGHILNMNMQTL